MQHSPSESNINVCPLGNAEEETLDYSKVVFGRSLSNKAVNKGGLKRFFEAKWQNNAGVKVEDYNDGIFILTFDRQSVKSRVLRGQPWYFSGNYLVLVDSEGLNQITVENFKHVPIWVQVFGIPLHRINKSLGMEIASHLGEFLEFHNKRTFMRIRVLWESSKPLEKGMNFESENGKISMSISFRYERISKFCYYCGCLDHIDRNCLDLMEKIEEGYNPPMNYDDQIKTAGLEHMIPSIPLAINWHGDINNTSLSRRLLGATRSHEEDASVSFSEKRVKVNDDGKGFTTNDFMEKGEQSENKRVRGETKGDKEELKAKEFLLSEGDQGNEEMDFYSGIFQFENIWIGDEECKSLIKNCWRSEENTPLISTIKNIQQCATNLDTWHQNNSRPAYEVARVSDIIESPGKWNNEVVNQYFNVADAECILSIPLSLFNHEDSWFWHYTNHGSYSVGSGYNLAMTVDKFQPSSASDVFSLWWKQFWGLKIPRKILHFAWRGYQEILPTRNGLFRRNIASSTSCQLCGFGGESNAHAIFWCPVAQGIWNLMEFSFLHEVKEEIDFKNVLLYASEVVDREAFAKFIICSWAIWTERNKITHGQHSLWLSG
ncbi:hypothetical protein F8388_004303 [Cannabis sativa]|uniref:CCHC-type domain-containing protein n=1 Tax=Cannabis sativa TaxID=3483 RepID=A0A7J6H9P7_CANSA|nr:hypothetical protein F8388_004303 [Cannabis sativa]